MSKKFKQAFALIGAGVFLVTSVSFSIYVIWQQNQNTGQQDQAANQQQNKEGQLQGTKLTDFTPGVSVEKLSYQDTQEGTGEPVKPGATITAHYTGALVSDGTIFQSSLDTGQPVTFGLDQVIQGWQEGVPGMKVGGTRRVLIPAELAYGPTQRPGIPANSDLVFDITLVAIQ